VSFALAACALAPVAVEAAPPVVIRHAKLHVGDGTSVDDATIVIADGLVKSVGRGDVASPAGAIEIDAAGRPVTPGFIAIDTSLGLVEIEMEGSTVDDARRDGRHVRASYDPAPAINADSTLIPIQVVEGVTSAAVAPTGGLISGQVTWIDLLPGDYARIVAKRRIAVDVQLGQSVDGSRAAALDELRRVLLDAREYRRRKGQFERNQMRPLAARPEDLDALAPALDGKVPLTVSVNRASDILALLELAKELRLRVVIVGGAEAWKVADRLAAAKVPVVLTPSKNLPVSFDALGARLENAALLSKAGVELVIADIGGAHNVRNARQEAGIAVAYGLDPAQAITALTLGAARIMGMDASYGSVAPGKVANVVIWDGDPLEVTSYPTHVLVRGEVQGQVTRQTLLRDRYLVRHGLAEGATPPTDTKQADPKADAASTTAR
jgi:imidazolonepropionase-like amidohydrolase